MRRLALLLIPALLIGAYVVADTSPLIRVFTFGDGGHGFMAGTFEDDMSGDCSGGSYTSTSGHTLTCNNTTSTADDAFGFTQGVQDGKARWFDGSNDYLSVADAAWMTPADDFSLVVAFTPHDVSGNGGLICQWDFSGVNERAYCLYASGANVALGLSTDGTGTAATTTTKASVLATGKMSVVVATYDKGTTTAKIYVDESAVQTNASVSASIYGATAPLEIGSYDTGGFPFYGSIHHVAYIDGVALSAAEAQRTIRHFRGMTSADGTNTVSVTSASPPMAMIAAPDSGVEPFLVPQPANSQTIGPYGLYGASGTTNLLHRGVLETYSGGFTGWLESGAVAQETGTMAEGLSSAKLTRVGGSHALIRSTCISCSDLCGSDPCNCDAYASAFIKGDSAPDLYLRAYQFDSSNCGTDLGNANFGGSLFHASSDWQMVGGAISSATWNANTSSIRLGVLVESADGDIYADAIYVGTDNPDTNDSYCGADSDASVSCNDVIASIANPFANHSPHFTMSVTAQTPWAGDDGILHYLFYIAGTSGNNNRLHITKSASGNFDFNVYDSSATATQAKETAVTWSADTSMEWVFIKDNDGRTTGYLDGTEFDTTDTGAIQDDNSDTIYIGNRTDGYTGNVHLEDLKFYRRRVEP